MKYMLLSDIHGSLPRLRQALSFYHDQHCDMLLLMGDILNYGPRNGVPEGLDAQGIATELNAMADDIIAVRGNCDSEVDQMLLHFPILSTYTLLVDEGRKILLTHGHVYNKTNLPPGHFDAVVYGHTHLWELSRNPNDTSDPTPALPCREGDTSAKGGSSQSSMFNVQCSKEQGPLICNTGSITFPKGGNPPTLGTMEHGRITIYNLNDRQPLAEMTIGAASR